MFRHLPLIVSLLLAASCVMAADDLYVGEVVLDDRQEVTSGALLEALDEVLVRLTGQTSISPVASLEIEAEQLDSLLQSQQLVRRERPDESGEMIEEVRLQAEFDEPAVNRMLRDNGMARWGRERPAILLWMAIEDDEGVRRPEAPQLDYLVRETARRLGLDIVRPLGDALDMAEVTLADIRGGFLDSSQAAAARYDAGVIAMLDLRREDRGSDPYWSGRWFWRLGGRESSFSHSGASVDSILAGGLERMASSMAARYAIQNRGGPGVARLSVDGVIDSVHFSEVMGYLENLSVVERVLVTGAHGRTLEFELEVNGGGLEEFLELGGLLEPAGRTQGEMLRYRLRR
ncbi:MAG: DUF2066 domain-containing protein [Wenzhouxiangella sp.]